MSATARDRLGARLDERQMDVIEAARAARTGLSPALALFLLDALVRLAESYLELDTKKAA